MFFRIRSLTAIFCALPLLGALAGDPITVSGAWVRAVPPSSSATAAFFTIHNNTDSIVRLVGGSSPAAEETEPMITTRKEVDGQNVMGMETVPGLEIQPHDTLVLEPGGDHLMLMGLTAPLQENEEIEITLRFEPGEQEVFIKAPVLRNAPDSE